MDVLGGWLNEIRFFYKRQVLWYWLMWRANNVFWQFLLRLFVPEIARARR